ncbi:MAG: nuclear transport factor 2 family protein [Actinomycetota bacterium]
MSDEIETHGRVVERYFAAMRVGAAAEDELLALFTDEAVYAEPFTGEEGPAVGREAIRDRLRSGWATPLPDLELDVISVEVAGDRATSTWECRSPVFPSPVRGIDEYEFADGRISRLVVRITS